MFSAETPSHKHSLRSKRTRQVAGNEESVKQPAQKKRRSALRRDTFEPLTDSNLNELAGRDRSSEKQNGHPIEPTKTHNRASSQTRDLTLRGGKKLEKRAERGDGLLTLSTNDYYTVSQLPALPEQIRNRPTVPYSCVISPGYDYILALTHTDALIWSYNASASTPSSREIISFKLPFPPASTNDPLPLAAFTAKSASDEPGVIVVSPRWGKVVYWESFTKASTYVPGQTTSGLQGTIPGMLSGESVKELVSAEPAGFILTFSHGRVAQVTVRDQLGRPNIGVTFLRKSTGSSIRGGIFGSIRNVFGGDRRKGTPLVRAGASAKAQREIVICTEDGDLEFWTINLSIGNSMSSSVSTKEQLTSALQDYIAKMPAAGHSQIKILDFNIAVTPASSHDIARRRESDSQSMVFLACITGSRTSSYFVIESVIAGEEINVKVVHPIRCYADILKESMDWRPRLCTSKFHSPAFVVFERAVVLMSLAKITESPSSQLLGERAALPEPFQDCIRFQDDTVYRIITFASEDIDNVAACIFAVQGFGIVRLTSHLQTTDFIDVENMKSGIGAKSKIEQAIFFGTKKANPLELKRASKETYEPEEIRLATLQISQEIVSSKSKYLPKTSSSIDDHIKQRSKSLQDLVEYVLKHFPGCLSRRERFILLWQGEKLAAAQALWKVQEGIQKTYPRKDDREMTYLNFALRALHESRQKYPQPEKGETDHVRHWLLHSVFRIDLLLVELESCLHDLSNMDVNDPRIVCDYLIEAVELWTAAYSAAFKFREDQATVFGLGDEVYQDGVLLSGYSKDIGQDIWTSSKEPLRFSQDLITDVCKFLTEWWDYQPAAAVNGSTNNKTKKSKQMPADLAGNPYDAPNRDSLNELARHLPEQVEIFNRILRENRIQDSVNIKGYNLESEEKEQLLAKSRYRNKEIMKQTIKWISPFNPEGAIGLAEKIGDTGLLVDLNLAYLIELGTRAQSHPEEVDLIDEKIHKLQEHVETYFDKFGNGWAYAHFSSLVQRSEVGRMLAEAQDNHGKKQPYLNWFFKKCAARDQQLGKVSWINDIIGESNFTRAGRTLEKVAANEETDVWSQKTEICLAKLVNLAAEEAKSTTSATESEAKTIDLSDTHFDNKLDYLEILELLSIHINAALADAIDNQAAYEMAEQTFIPKNIASAKKLSSIHKSISTTLAKIINNEVLTLPELIDALTLLNLGDKFEGSEEQDPDIVDHEFAYALKAIDAYFNSHLREGTTSDHEKLTYINTVWRRLLIRDDWTKLNDTSGKSDQAVTTMQQNSIACKTIVELLYQASLANSEVYIPSIDDLLIAYSSGEEESGQEKVDEQTKAEVKQLKTYVDKARLKDHFGGLITWCRGVVRVWRNAEGEQAAEHSQEVAEILDEEAVEDDNIMQSVEVDEEDASA